MSPKGFAHDDLSQGRMCVSSARVKEKWNIVLPVLLLIAFAVTRWPDFMPPNFSAAYALACCAGA
jgi:hypothetical protein